MCIKNFKGLNRQRNTAEILLTLLHGSETLTIKAIDINKMQSVEMRHLETVKGCTRPT
jgi:hypothetical protein